MHPALGVREVSVSLRGIRVQTIGEVRVAEGLLGVVLVCGESQIVLLIV